MQDPEVRAAMRAEWDAGSWPSVGNNTGNLANLIVNEVGHSEYERCEGSKVGDIAKEQGKHVVDALLDLVVADELKTELGTEAGVGNAKHVAEIAKSPYVAAGVSDGGAHVRFQTNGRYPTEMITWLVRDEGVLTLEEAHHSLSFIPAFLSGLRDRGSIREGAPADVVVYDLERLGIAPGEIVHDFPAGEWRRVQRAEGYRWIIVNGKVTQEDGNPSGELPGRLLRNGRG